MAVLPDGRGDTASSEESTALDAYSQVVTAIAAKLTPQVAALRVQGSSRNGQRREGAGSAVVFTHDGFLLTNAHVVAGAAGGTAAFADGTQTPVDVIGAGVYPRARRTARSERGSAPITSTGVWVPSAKAAVPPAAPATTWALVRRNPSSVKTTADPAPSRRWPLRELPCTRSAATCGVSFAAIAVTTESTRRALSTLRNSRCRPCHLEEQPSPASCLHDYCPTPAGGTLCR